jgi:hypothetical protein
MDVSGAIQRAVFAKLTSTPEVTALIGQRVFDRVTTAATFPYVTIFDAQVIEDGADEIDADEVFFDLHIWSRKVGALEAKEIAGAVRRALHETDLDLGDDHALVDVRFRSLQVLRDDDGLTTHAVQTFHALTETTSD